MTPESSRPPDFDPLASPQFALVPQNSPAEVRRDGEGRFAPGVSGNPGGRPKAVKSFLEAARALTGEALSVLETALSSEDERVRVMAAGMILERGWGRPGAAPPVAADEFQTQKENLFAMLREAINREGKEAAVRGIGAKGKEQERLGDGREQEAT